MYICTSLYICTRTVVRQPTAAYRAQNHDSLAELICWLGFRVYWLGPITQSHPHPIFLVPLSFIFLNIFLLFLLLQLIHPCSPSFLPLVFFLSFLLLHFPSLLSFPSLPRGSPFSQSYFLFSLHFFHIFYLIFFLLFFFLLL